MLKTLMTRELNTYAQNPLTSNPLINESTIHNIPAFIIILKSPRVRIFIGSDNNLIIGLINRLNRPKSSPAINAILNLSHTLSPIIFINGKKYEATAIEKVRIIQSNSHLSK